MKKSFLFATLALVAPAVGAADRPNIVLILTDDLGWGASSPASAS